MILALLVSCAALSLPVLVGMAIVKHAGVCLSDPRPTPLNDDMPYVRWDEGLLGHLVRAGSALHVRYRDRANVWAETDPAGTVWVWEVGVVLDGPSPSPSGRR